jgi:hypothetical protein
MRLSDDDGRAVDLLLNQTGGQANGNGNGNGGATSFVSPATRVQAARLNSAERLLQLLDADVAPEPPADLVERTLRRIEQAAEAGHEPATRPVLGIAPDVQPRPHA